MECVRDYSLEKELEVCKAMFEALPQSMLLLDKYKNMIGIFNASPQTLAGVPVDQIVGKNIEVFANDPTSPFHQACTMLSSTFDQVFETGTPLKFQYAILDVFFEATITKISGERVLSQVRDISEIVHWQQEIEAQKHDELSMALMAGGLTSWSYDVRTKKFSSKQDNDVIENNMPSDALMARMEPEHRHKTIEMLNDIIVRGLKHSHTTVQVRDRLGTIQWNDVHAIPLEYGSDGSVLQIVGSQKDVTKELKYNEKLRTLVKQNELILNNMNSGLAYLAPDLSVEWENVSNIFSDPEILRQFQTGKFCDGILRDGHSDCLDIVREALESKTRTVGKIHTSRGLVVEAIAQPVFCEQDGSEGIVLRLDNITRKEQVFSELAQAKEEAERSVKLKSSFLANMSHEIRTPLNSIVGFAQLIPEAETPQEQQEYIAFVNSNSEMLLNLINDILDLSKIEAGYLSCNDTRFNLSELYTDVESLFKYKMRDGVKLLCDIPRPEFFVNLDRMRISQVITNFMTNAVKFTKQGHIKLGFAIVPEGVKLYVEDTGSGMTEEQTRRVFDRFEKFNVFEQGTGLGTSIAKAIIEVYNGQIGVESQDGRGSTFWAILPVNAGLNPESGSIAGEQAPASEQVNGVRDRSSVRVLIAEDNKSNYLLLRALLKDYRLMQAWNGFEAVELARTQHFDVILMDMQMPVMDGVEAIRRIRTFDPTTPIIAVTANAFDEDRRRAFEAGVTGFLTKPLDKAKLMEILERC